MRQEPRHKDLENEQDTESSDDTIWEAVEVLDGNSLSLHDSVDEALDDSLDDYLVELDDSSDSMDIIQANDAIDNPQTGMNGYADDGFVLPESDDMDSPSVFTLKDVLGDTSRRQSNINYILGSAKDTRNIRLPISMFENYNINVLKDEDSERAKQFIEFYKSPRDQWIKTKFYRDLYERVILPTAMLGSDAQATLCKKWIYLMSVNRLQIERQSNHGTSYGCNGCGKMHFYCSYVAMCLDVDGNETDKWKLGRFCGKRIFTLMHLFCVLNWLMLLPVEDQIMANSYAILTSAIDSCQTASLAYNEEKGKSEDDILK